jgi:Ca2+/Na+ antiporter
VSNKKEAYAFSSFALVAASSHGPLICIGLVSFLWQVANVLGSNVFNILVGLGAPWLVNSLATGGEPYALNPDEPLGVLVLIMLLYLVGFLLGVKFCGWALSPRLAYSFFAGHLCFVAFAVVVTFVDLGF